MKKRFFVFFNGSFEVEAESEEGALELGFKQLELLPHDIETDSVEVEADDADEEDEDEQ